MVDLEPMYDCVAGLDVHLNKVVVCVLCKGEDGTVERHLREFGGFKRDRQQMAEWIASFKPQAVSMESTGIYWKSPYVALERVGIRAKVVNAAHASKVEGRKTDVSDAQWLAMLTRAGLLRGSYIPTERLRHLRQLARYHDSHTKVLAAEKNRLLKILGDGGMRLSALVSDPHGHACRAMVDAILQGATPHEAVVKAGRLKADREQLCASLDHELSDIHVWLAQHIRAQIEQEENYLRELERKLQEELKPYEPLLALLWTIPGIDHLAAAKLLVELGDDLSVFETAGRLAAWAGVCPGNNESAGKHKPAKTRKGNQHVRRVLVQVANAAARTRCFFRDKYQSLRGRLGHKQAIVAIAHKIIKVIYAMLLRREPYQDRGLDMEKMRVMRHAPRWIRELKRFGMLPAGQ